jgi:hypothetical protein
VSDAWRKRGGDNTKIGGALRMEWTLWGAGYSTYEVSDSFMVGRFYLRLERNRLKMEAEEEENDALVSAARTLAERYIATLQKYIPAPIGTPMTDDEFASVRAWDGPRQDMILIVHGKTPTEPLRFSHGLRIARHEMLASSDPYLCRCYDYLEDAREDENNYLFHLYKFVEKLEEPFGGEASLIRALKMKNAIKGIKRLANASEHDARHPSKVGEEVRTLSAEDRRLAMAWAYEILAAYERHIRSRARYGSTPL